MKISTIKGLCNYLTENSGFSAHTVRSVISSLGYRLSDTKNNFKELSGVFIDCTKHGADNGFSGFNYPCETIKFFIKHRQDIVSHMEQFAAEIGSDIISMVQDFGVFRHSKKPTSEQIGKALWDSRYHSELNNLYNVFSWYALEEISRTWYRYLEDNPAYSYKLSA